jgi:hypothetical protein
MALMSKLKNTLAEVKIAEVQEASEKDKTVCKIRECIEKNNWTKEGELKPYFIVRKDLTVHESIILKGRTLVIPRKLRQRILQLAHESHQGVLKTKQLLREKEASCTSAIFTAFGTSFCAK